MGDVLPLLFTLFAVVIILYLSYVFTRIIGKKVVRRRNSDYMKIVDTLIISQDKSIIILKAENKYYLMSSSAASINLITELKDFKETDSIKTEDVKIIEGIDFKDILNNAFQHRKSK